MRCTRVRIGVQGNSLVPTALRCRSVMKKKSAVGCGGRRVYLGSPTRRSIRLTIRFAFAGKRQMDPNQTFNVLNHLQVLRCGYVHLSS